MNKLELFTIDNLPLFSLNKKEVEEMFGLKLDYVHSQEDTIIRLDSGKALKILPYDILNQRPEELRDENFSIDKREADIILDYKRRAFLDAVALVSVTYTTPYCRGICDKTILAEGYPVKIVD